MKKTILSLLSLALAVPAAAAPASERKVVATTSIKNENCVLVDADSLYPNPEIDFFRQECGGLGGYQVIFKGGDIRSTVGVIYGKKELSFPVRHGQFPNVASDTLEWRATVKDNKTVTYEALVFKVTASDPDAEGSPNEILTWVAVKLAGAKSCVIGAVDVDKDGKKDALAEVRQIADGAAKAKCLAD